MDGKHIVFQAPKSAGSYYYNYKGTHSIVLLAVVDANYKFLYVNVGTNGRVSDGGVWAECPFEAELNQGTLNLPNDTTLPGGDRDVPFVILADAAFPLRRNILKPYPLRNLTRDQRIFNYRVSRGRRVVENVFGILANRFRCLLTTLNLSPEKVELVTLTCCVLHNFLRVEQETYITPTCVDSELEDGTIMPGEWRRGNELRNNAAYIRSRPTMEAINIRESFKKFKSKSDTIDHGTPYEEAMLLWEILRLLEDRMVTDFKISSNHPDFGNFDDLVVKIEYENGKSAYNAYQFKHSDNGKKTIKRENLEIQKGDFSIGEYYEKNHETNEKFTFILYTNRPLQQISATLDVRYKNPDKVDKVIRGVQVIKRDNNLYTFEVCRGNQKPPENEASFIKFLKRFRLETEHNGFKKLKTMCEKKFCKLFGAKAANFIIFKDFVNKWYLEKRDKNLLRKKFIIVKVVESLLTPSIAKYIKYEGEDNEMVHRSIDLLKEAISKSNVTIFHSTDVWNKIKWTNSHNLEDINKSGFQNFLIAKSYESEEDLEEEPYTKISWHQGQYPFHIEVTKNNVVLVNKSLKLLSQNGIADKKVILLCARDVTIKKYENLKNFHSLHDLKTMDEKLYEQIAKSFECSFQGKKCNLRAIVDDDSAKIFTTECLLKSAEGKLTIGGNKEDVPQSLMPRKLHKVIIDSRVTDVVKTDDLIVVSYNDSKEETQNAEKIFFGQGSRIKHHFRECNGSLEWIKSIGSIETLQHYRDEAKIHLEEELSCLRNSHHNINIICADPGLGKSTMLKYFKNEYQVGHWVCFIDSKQQKKYFLEKNADVKAFVLSFFKSNELFEKELVKILYDKRKIVFLWDALDEISDQKEKERALSFIKQVQQLDFLQWISSRRNLKQDLEQEFNTFAKNIEQFDEEQQNSYIKQRLSPIYKNEDIIELANTIKQNMTSLGAHAILGIPLQLYLLTEFLLQHAHKSEDLLLQPITLTQLYQSLIEGKLNHYFFKKSNFEKEDKEKLKRRLLETYQIVGFQICFPSLLNLEFIPLENELFEEISGDSTDSVGLLSKSGHENTVGFMHHTFAEYFAALYIAVNHGRMPGLKKIYFEESFKNIKYMLDLVLSQEYETHSAVLRHDLTTLKKAGEKNYEEDEKGRTPLHVALSYTNQSFYLPKLDAHENSQFDRNWSKMEVVIFLLQQYFNNGREGLLTHCDKFLQQTCFDYANRYLPLIAILTKNLKIVEFVMRTENFVSNRNGDTALMYAAFMANEDIIQYLVDREENINRSNVNGNTALHFCLERGVSCQIVKLLVGHGADVNKEDKLGYRAIHYAASHDDEEVMKFIIENSSDLNCESRNKWTPLMIATSRANLKITKLLVEKGADRIDNGEDSTNVGVVNSLQMFGIRAGTRALGTEYEDKMIAHFSLLLAQDPKVRDFKISTNDPNYGNFDDLVMQVDYREPVGRETAGIQLKYHQGTRILTASNFLRETGDFSLLKYFKTTERIKIPEEVSFVLLTNRKFVTENSELEIELADESGKKSKLLLEIFQPQEEDQPRIIQFIKLNTRSQVFQFKVRNINEHKHKIKKFKNFVRRFYFYSSEDDVRLIEDKLRKQFLGHSTCEQFVKFVENWNKESKKFKLIKETVISKFMEFLLSPYASTSLGEIPGQDYLFDKLFSQFDVTIFEESAPVVQGYDRNFIETRKTKITWKEEKLFGLSKEPDAVKLLWHLNEIPLIIESDCPKEILRKILSLGKDEFFSRRFVVIGKVDESFKERKMLRDLVDLFDERLEEHLKKCKVNLQGRELLLLDYVKDDREMAKLFSIKDIASLLTGRDAIFLGENVRETFPYINRLLQIPIIKLEILSNISNSDVIVISCRRQRDFLKNKNLFETEMKRIIFFEEFCSSQEFRDICSKHQNKNVHHLELTQKNTLLWVSTKGEIQNLVNYLSEEEDKVVLDSEIFKNFTNKMNVLCAKPGMGKSVLMEFLVHNCPKNLWPVLINLREYAKIFIKNPNEIVEDIIESKYRKSDLTKKIANLMYSRKKILLLLDGLDELLPEHVQKVIAAMKFFYQNEYLLWVASRSHLKNLLERELQVFAFNLAPLDENNQRLYIKTRLNCDQKREDQIMTHLKKHRCIDLLNDPLQLFMLSEILKEDRNSQDFIALTDIYSKFVDMKCELFNSKIANPKEEILHLRKLRQLQRKLLREYQVAGVLTCFGNKYLNELKIDPEMLKDLIDDMKEDGDDIGFIVGLVEDVIPVFVHQTYAEYFGALYMKENVSRIGNFLPNVLASNNEYHTIRFMLDMMLANASKLHLRVIYGDVEIIEACECLPKDLIGRSPADLACIYDNSEGYYELPQKGNPLMYEATIDLRKWKKNNDERRERKIPTELYNINPDVDVFLCCESLKSLFPLEILLRISNSVDHQRKITSLKLFRENICTFILCCVLNNYVMLLSLLEKIPPMKIEVTDEYGVRSKENSLLHFLVRFGGFDDNKMRPSINGEVATANGYTVIKILVEKGVNIDRKNEDGDTALLCACQWRIEHPEIAASLIKMGADINAQNKYGITALLGASSLGHENVVLRLLEGGADVNAQNKDGNTALLRASALGHEDVVLSLIEGGANINAQNINGNTALMEASKRRHCDVVNILIQNKADVNAQNKYGHTALLIARNSGYEDIVNILATLTETV